MESICPQCHTQVRPTDFFCFNCGKNLKPKPLSTSLETLFMYYLGALVLPPLGIVWGIKYIKQESQMSKVHGIVLIILTIVEIVVLTIWTINFINMINAQVGSQLNNLQGF